MLTAEWVCCTPRSGGGKGSGRGGKGSSITGRKCKFDIVFQVTQAIAWNKHDNKDLVKSFATIGNVKNSTTTSLLDCRELFPVVDGIVRDSLAEVRFDIAAKMVRL